MSQPSSKLVEAAAAGDFETLRQCLAAGADPDTRRDGRPALHLAVLSGSDAAVLALLDGGADANLLDDQGLAALDLALEGAALEEGAFDPEAMSAQRAALSPATIDRLIAVTTVRDSPLGDGEWDEELDVGGVPEVELAELSPELVAHYAPAAVEARWQVALEAEAGSPFLLALAQRCGHTPRPSPFGPYWVLTCEPATAAASEVPGEQGFVVLEGDPDEAGRPTLEIFPSKNPLEVLAYFGAGDPAADRPEGFAQSQLLELFRQNPARFTTIYEDELVGRFVPPPANGWALAVELCNLCPNAAEAAGGTLEGLIERLESTGDFHLTWN